MRTSRSSMALTTKRPNEQVKRNHFVFQLTKQELANEWGGRPYSPYAFTEHGALMAANVLNSSRAIEVSIYAVRAFVRMRETMATHKQLAKKLDELEKKTAELATKHDALASDTRSQLAQVIAALRQLMTGPEPARRPIGFVTQAKT